MFTKVRNALRILSNPRDKSLTRQAIENSTYSFFINLTSKAGGLIFTILLARMLMPELFGLYALVLSIIMTIATFTDLGINTALSRYLADSLAKGKRYESEARSRARFFFNLKILLSFGVSILLFLLAPLISTLIFKKAEMITPLQIGSLYLFVMALQGFFGTMFYPLRKLKYNLFSEIIFQIVKIGMFLLLMSLYRQLSTVFWVFIISTAVSGIFYFTTLTIKRKSLFFGKTIPIEKRKITIFMGWAVLFSSLVPLVTYINTFILGLFVANEFLGYYSVIFSLVLPISTFISFNAVFLPIFTEIKKERLLRGFKKVVKYSCIFGVPASIGLAFIILPIIRVFYGSNYVPVLYYIPILITSILICLLIIEEILVMNYISLFIAKEKMKVPTTVLALNLLFNIILAFVLIKVALPFGQQWALVAIAISIFLTRYLLMFSFAILAKKQLNIKIIKKDIFIPLGASLIMLAFLFIFNKLLNPGLALTIIMVILAAAVYFISLFFIERLSKFIKC